MIVTLASANTGEVIEERLKGKRKEMDYIIMLFLKFSFYAEKR